MTAIWRRYLCDGACHQPSVDRCHQPYMSLHAEQSSVACKQALSSMICSRWQLAGMPRGSWMSVLCEWGAAHKPSPWQGQT